MISHRVFGITGWKNSGKTTLVAALVKEFISRGYRVSTVKHAHHAFDIDTPGKDSHQHREAGASEVLVASDTRWALMHEQRGTPAPGLDDLLKRIAPCDLVLVEGFKRGTHMKIEVVRERGVDSLIADSDPQVLAIATDRPHLFPSRQTLDLLDVPSIADFIAEVCRLPRATRTSQDPASYALATKIAGRAG